MCKYFVNCDTLINFSSELWYLYSSLLFEGIQCAKYIQKNTRNFLPGFPSNGETIRCFPSNIVSKITFLWGS